MHTPGFLFERIYLARGKVLLIFANVEIIEQLLERTAGLQDELDLFEKMKSPMSLRDIVRQRNCRAANLISERKFFEVWQPLRHPVDRFAKLACELINDQILESPITLRFVF